MREPLVLLPGLVCDARLYGPQIADLSRDHAVMVAPVSEGERIEEIASNVLDVLPKRCALAGWGLGGIVAMEVIRRAPDRVTRLCLMSTTPLPETPQQAAERDPRIIRVRAGKYAQVIREEYHSDLLMPGPWRAEILALVEDMALGQGPDCFVRQSRALQRRRDQQANLRRINAPVLILSGAEDVRAPVKRQSFMAELIPGAELTVLEGVAHFPTLEAPEQVCDALRAWMKRPLLLR